MKIGNRNLSLSFILHYEHYLAFVNIFLLCKHPIDFLSRYIFNSRKYPCTVKIKTPLGIITPTAYSHADILTINVIFFRKDYRVKRGARVIVDVGSNIGISALYFLTQDITAQCYLHEPVPANILRLESNLNNFVGRYQLCKSAVYTEDGYKNFGVEASGVFGGLHRDFDRSIKVNCININSVLNDILKKHQCIDVLKVDIEGDELAVIQSIEERWLKRIKLIYFEFDFNEHIEVFPGYFKKSKRGTVYRLKLYKRYYQ